MAASWPVRLSQLAYIAVQECETDYKTLTRARKLFGHSMWMVPSFVRRRFGAAYARPQGKCKTLCICLRECARLNWAQKFTTKIQEQILNTQYKIKVKIFGRRHYVVLRGTSRNHRPTINRLQYTYGRCIEITAFNHAGGCSTRFYQFKVKCKIAICWKHFYCSRFVGMPARAINSKNKMKYVKLPTAIRGSAKCMKERAFRPWHNWLQQRSLADWFQLSNNVCRQVCAQFTWVFVCHLNSKTIN